MYLDAILSSNVFETFTESLIIRDCDGTSVVDVIVVWKKGVSFKKSILFQRKLIPNIENKQNEKPTCLH